MHIYVHAYLVAVYLRKRTISVYIDPHLADLTEVRDMQLIGLLQQPGAL